MQLNGDHHFGDGNETSMTKTTRNKWVVHPFDVGETDVSAKSGTHGSTPWGLGARRNSYPSLYTSIGLPNQLHGSTTSAPSAEAT